MNDPQPQEPQPEQGKPRVPHGDDEDARRSREQPKQPPDKSHSPEPSSGDTPTPGP